MEANVCHVRRVEKTIEIDDEECGAGDSDGSAESDFYGC